MKHKACAECGVASFSCELPAEATQQDVLAAVAKFNADPAVHGILVQLPVRDWDVGSSLCCFGVRQSRPWPHAIGFLLLSRRAAD